MRHLHLIIAGLQPDPAPGDAAPFQELPALRALLARGRRLAGDYALSPAQRLARLGVEATGQRLALAPLRRARDGLEASDPAWLCADPVHLRLMRDHILLGDAHTFEIDAGEAAALVAGLNQHFLGRVEFQMATAERWYARLSEPTGARSAPLDTRLGRAVEAGRGERPAQASDLAALVNEVQMYLHDHPVNEAREARAADPVNSVWFWGVGEVLKPCLSVETVYGESPLAEAVALAAGVAYQPLAACGAALDAPGDRALAFIDSLHAPASYAQFSAWRQRLRELEAEIFQPLLAGLRRGRVDRADIEVLGAAGYGLQLDRWEVWKFWRS